jgi:tetratricopeptide (TPR) repeat protein
MAWRRLAFIAVALLSVLSIAPDAAAADGHDVLALIAKPTFGARSDVLERASRGKPDLLPRYLVCMSLLRQQRYGDAELACRPLTVLDSQNPSAFRMYGAAELGLKEYAAARTDFLQAVSLDPDDADSYALLASLYREEQSYRESIAYFSIAIRKRPYDGRMWNGRCWVRALAGIELPRAMADCQRAFLLYPDSDTLDSMGFISLRWAQYRNAYRYYDAALILDPSLPSSLFGRGIAALHIYGAAKARQDIAAALRIDASAAAVFIKAHLVVAQSPLLLCQNASCRPRERNAAPRVPTKKKTPAGPVVVTKL